MELHNLSEKCAVPIRLFFVLTLFKLVEDYGIFGVGHQYKIGILIIMYLLLILVTNFIDSIMTYLNTHIKTSDCETIQTRKYCI